MAPQPDKYSETFIRDQVEGLPGEVEFLYGGRMPSASDRGLPPTYPSVRLLGRAASRVTGRSAQALCEGLVRRLPGLSHRDGLVRYLSASGFDVVLAHYGQTGVVMSEICRAAGVPLVVHFHGYDAYRKDVLARWGEAYGRVLGRASAVVAVSRDMMGQLRGLGVPEDVLHFRPYGVDVEAFTRSGSGRADGPPRALAVGRFVEKKAPHLTILAFREAAAVAPSAELHMLGDGPLLDACRTLADAVGLDDRVEFHGAVPHDRVREWMARAHCFVQHSVVAPDGDSEGTPVALLEAAASGLPIVATRHAGIDDVLEDGVSGRLVDEGDIEGMGEALREVFADPDAAGRMGRAARRRVRDDYSKPDAIRGLYRILRGAARSGA
ncbi:MAG: glycosyltransferase [Gemmatimonadota bacterium]